ncbi:hypothetical protein [Haloferax larsenii]|uniref:Uncharacterized protein n=1 Tax=Haloferax larsenii TaxID=302484 RepID=A0A1H7L9B6_HALLR|nr:hypothetical protein [Haloferax larsenii]SEK95541.1 hypothetical protein SAMN04488691_102253 [Haloferax larsenii]
MLQALFGTVSAEEATSSDLERIKHAPGVQKILSELGVRGLPSTEKVEKRRISDDGKATDGELLLMKAHLEYGTLIAMESGDKIGATFTFDVDLSSAPAGYSVTTETGGTLGASDSGLVFTRNATDSEEKQVLNSVNVDGEIEGSSIIANSAVNGFQANLQVKNAKTGETEIQERVIQLGESFNPKIETLSDSNSTFSRAPTLDIKSSQPRLKSKISPKQILKEVIVSWLANHVISESLDYLGVECDDTCTGCALYVYDLVTTCRTCVAFCSTSVSGVNAILCVVCFYAFCNNSIGQANCAACFACLLTGDEPDVPPNPSAAFLDWVWDELPEPPAMPSIPNFP